jgi:RsiW-degrading membrane proteinase PrsW (M82 family)
VTTYDVRARQGLRQGRPYRTFLGFTAMALCGLVVLGIVALTQGPGPFLLGLLFALIPVPLLFLAVLALDRYEPEPAINLAFTFVWGASVACLLALILNELDQAWLTSALGRANGDFFTAVIGAPIVEETAKGLVILGLLRLGRGELDGPIDGIVYAGAVGIGFAMTENVLYYSRVVHEAGGVGLAATFVLRGVLSPFAHPLFTSATGIGLGFAALSRRRAVRIGAPALGLLVAVLLHATWNAAAGSGIGVLALVYLLIFLPVLAGVIVVAVAERRRLRWVIAHQLRPYADAGWVAPYEVAMFASLPQRRRARDWARAHGGPAAAKAMRRYQLAATELALLHERAARGLPDRRFRERRDHLLAELRRSRDEVLARLAAGRAAAGGMPAYGTPYGAPYPAPPGQWGGPPSWPAGR